jgi:AAA domain
VKRKNNWYEWKRPTTSWLVDGLIPSDGTCCFLGKPKSGKSSAVRNLTASVITNSPFLGRTVLTVEPAKVLFLHLDRKDVGSQVAYELSQLVPVKEDQRRLILYVASDLPSTFTERLQWLTQEIKENQPSLIVIDLLMYFLVLKSANDYNETIQGINLLLDTLTKTKYKGALVVTQHARKAEASADSFDDGLGSTAQRASFVTNMMFKRRREELIYTVQTEQTLKDEKFGEIDESVIERQSNGEMRLTSLYAEIRQSQRQSVEEAELSRLVDFIAERPDSTQLDLVNGLGMSKPTVLRFLRKAQRDGLVVSEGSGVKGDAIKYSKFTMAVLDRAALHVQ